MADVTRFEIETSLVDEIRPILKAKGITSPTSWIRAKMMELASNNKKEEKNESSLSDLL